MDLDPGPSRLIIIAALLIILFFFSIPFAAAQSNDNFIQGYFKPSGPGSSGYSYDWYFKTWSDKCPNCHHHSLVKNLKDVPEHEINCPVCGCDFDGVTGWEKRNPPRWRLYKFVVKKVVKKRVKPILTHRELIRLIILKHSNYWRWT